MKSVKNLRIPSILSPKANPLYKRQKQSFNSSQSVLRSRHQANSKSAAQLSPKKTLPKEADEAKGLHYILALKQQECEFYRSVLNRYLSMYKQLYDLISTKDSGLKILNVARKIRRKIKTREISTPPHEFHKEFATIYERTEAALRKMPRNN